VEDFTLSKNVWKILPCLCGRFYLVLTHVELFTLFVEDFTLFVEDFTLFVEDFTLFFGMCRM